MLPHVNLLDVALPIPAQLLACVPACSQSYVKSCKSKQACGVMHNLLHVLKRLLTGAYASCRRSWLT